MPPVRVFKLLLALPLWVLLPCGPTTWGHNMLGAHQAIFWHKTLKGNLTLCGSLRGAQIVRRNGMLWEPESSLLPWSRFILVMFSTAHRGLPSVWVSLVSLRSVVGPGSDFDRNVITVSPPTVSNFGVSRGHSNPCLETLQGFLVPYVSWY